MLQVDYQKLATLAGFKTAASASNSFFLVKKKINAGAGAGAVAVAMAKPNAAEGDGEGDANGAEAGGPNQDEGPATPPTPAPKKRARKVKAPPASGEDANGVTNGEENGDEPTEPSPTTPKKRVRKPKTIPQSGDEATPPKKRARRAAKPKAGVEVKVETPHSGGKEDLNLPTPASPSPVKKRARKPKDSAKSAKKSAEIVTGNASADEAENEVTSAATIGKTVDGSMADTELGYGDNQPTGAAFDFNVASNKAGSSTVLAAEVAAATAYEHSKSGQSNLQALVAGDEEVPVDEMDDNAEGEATCQGLIPA